ncbi:Vacuolar protein, partial [Coemansia sp. RSA 2673]
MSASIHPSSEWHAVQNVFYRKHRIYQMQWAELDLSRFRVAASSFGGPIALLRDDRFSWNSREQLVCVQEDGIVRVFSLSGHEPTFFSLLGSENSDRGSVSIVDCRFWDQGGLVAMTSDFTFIYVNDIGEPKPRALANARLTAPPHSWTVVPPHLTLSHHVEVLASVGATVLSIDAAGVQDQLLDHGPYARISVSPNGRL